MSKKDISGIILVLRVGITHYYDNIWEYIYTSMLNVSIGEITLTCWNYRDGIAVDSTMSVTRNYTYICYTLGMIYTLYIKRNYMLYIRRNYTSYIRNYMLEVLYVIGMHYTSEHMCNKL